MPTLTCIDSFQHQVLELPNSGLDAWYLIPTAQGSPPAHSYTDITFDAANARTPGHAVALKQSFNTTRASQVRSTFAGGAVMVASFYFKSDSATNPAANLGQIFFIFGCPTNCFIGLNSSGQLTAQVGSGTTQTSGIDVCDGEWHRFDGRYDRTTTSGTLDWQIDGTAQTQATGTVVTGNATDWNIGGTGVANTNYVIYYSDMVISNTSGDYPIGDHICKMLEINATGTHNKGSGAFSDEAGNTTDAELLNSVDDVWDGTTPNLTQTGEDHIKQTANDTTAYLEFGFEDPGESTIWGVRGSVLFAALDSTLACSGRTTFIANAQMLGDTGTIDPSTSSTAYNGYREMLSAPTGGWDNSKLSGATVRMGYALDAAPDLVWNSAILEYAAPWQEVKPGLIDQSATLFAPTITTGGASPQSVSPGLLDQSATMFSPTVGPPGVLPGLIDQSATIFSPLAGPPGPQVGLIDQSATLFAPTVGPPGVTPPLLDQSATLFAPTVTPGNVNVAPALLDQTAVIFAPTITQGAITVDPALLDQSAVIFAPVVGPPGVLPALLNQSAAIFGPTVVPEQFVTIGLLDQSAVIFAPTVNQGMGPGLIDQHATIFAPQVNQSVAPALLDQSAEVFPPSIAGGTPPPAGSPYQDNRLPRRIRL